ncbi:MAG: tetratricopeptide repeat protein [Polyangiaceae bacterium]|nr:tetratricopeptide repeat protein [Polyangiaceae bacterium]
MSDAAAGGTERRCTACGHTSPEGARFCEACGGDLAAVFSRCGACGRDGRPGACFCVACGSALPRPPRPDECPRCGELARPRDRHCAACGARLRGRPVERPPGAGAPGPSAAPRPSAAGGLGPTEGAPDGDEERKLVTVLFADVSGFTAMSEKLDPEAVRDIMDRCFEVLTREITNRGGTIDKFIGDAVMAYFGIPVAHEDDALRAVRAALAMQAALVGFADKLEAEVGARLAMRIGLNTGMVLAGRVGGLDRKDFTIYGDAVNTASRLEHAADVGGVLVSHETYLAVRAFVEVEDRPPLKVKGKDQPLEVHRVLAERRRPARLGMRGVPGVEVPMLGRELELRVVSEWIAETQRRKKPGIVNVVGVAGIGKSRLVNEAVARAEAEVGNLAVLRTRCLPPGSGQPMNLIRDLVDELVPEDLEAEPELALPLLEKRYQIEHGDAVALAWFMGLPVEPEAKDTGRELRLRRALHGVRRLLEQRSASAEVLVVVCEDIHWAPDATLDFLDLLGDALDAPILLVCLQRPELYDTRPTWAEGKRYQHRVDLRPLPDEIATELVRALCARLDRLPDELVRAIVARAGGNPFFLEEIVKLLLERGLIARHESGWTLDPGWQSRFEVPASIQGLLQSRVDALPREERQILQEAAVVGAVFWTGAVEALHGEPVGPALERARSRGLVHRRASASFEGEEEYAFASSILCEVLHERVLKKQRQSMHAGVARWIEQASGGRPERAACQPGYAEHLEAAGELERAARAYRLAGDAARALFANQEARLRYERAAELAGRLDAGAFGAAERFVLFRHLGEACAALQEYAAAFGAFETALASATEAEAPAGAVASVKRARADALLRQGQAERAAAEASEACELLGAGEPEELAACLELLARIRYHQGAYDEAERVCRQALGLTRELRTRAQLDRVLLMVHFGRGEVDEALGAATRAVAIARELEDELLLGQAMLSLGNALFLRGDHEASLRASRKAGELAERVGDAETLRKAHNNSGELYIHLGRHAEARPALERAITEAERWGVTHQVSDTHRLLGDVHYRFGQLDEARTSAAAALALARAHGERHFEAEALRLQAQIALSEPGTEPAVGLALFEDARRILEAIRGEAQLAHAELALAQTLHDTTELGQGDERRKRARELAEAAATAFARLGLRDEEGRARALAGG